MAPSSNGSIVDNVADDGAPDPQHIERPLSKKNIGIRGSLPVRSRKRSAPESLRDKSKITDAGFDCGSGSKRPLLDPTADETGRLQRWENTAYDPAGTVTKWSDPRVTSAGQPHQSQPLGFSGPSKWKIPLQPDLPSPLEEQLVKEARGIYAGLVMVERKCIAIDQQQIKKHEDGEPAQLKKKQWQALVAMHRTLLQEHYDFFLATLCPSASSSLRYLPQKYAMPARMLKHGIYSFLEILGRRLPDSLEHLLSFFHLAYSMMTLLVESVPSFKNMWIECLGDLARHRMTAEADQQNREVWAGMARYWYNQGADRNPTAGRIQRHLAIIAESNILQQLFFYTKSLVCVQPFSDTSDSISQLFNATYQPVHRSVHPVMTSFTEVHRNLFTCDSVQSFIDSVDKFIPYLDNQIGRVGAKWREQGVYIASTNISAILGYGKPENKIIQALREDRDPSQLLQKALDYWNSLSEPETSPQPESISKTSINGIKLTSLDILPFASRFSFYTLGSVVQHTGDKNVIPFVHVSLVFLWSLALTPNSMKYIEAYVPWRAVERFLNTLPRQGTSEPRIQSEEFPKSGIILPEDYLLRGQIWSENYYPKNFFDDSPLDMDERPLEFPSIAGPRVERCLWLAARISMVRKYSSSLKFTLLTSTLVVQTLAYL